MQTTENSRPEFVPGLELAERLFNEAVAPILDRHLPGLEYSAGLIGPGSEVLGFDDAMSRDHHWGPRVMLFLDGPDLDAQGETIRSVLAEHLPESVMGYPTNWSEPDVDNNGVQMLQTTGAGRVNHRVELFTLSSFFDGYMGIDIREPLSPADWLTLPWQKLRSISAGKVFCDNLGLGAIRERLGWYPHDVWLYVLASCWKRIGQEEHLMGRAGSAGDEAGSAIIASRLARDIMRLAFLMERVYPPYAKWFGRAFADLPCAPTLLPALTGVLHASSWQDRDAGLAKAYGRLAEMHNALGVTHALPSEPSPFWTRPFTVIWGDRYAEAIVSAIEDPLVKAIAGKRVIGSIDLVTDNTDVLEDAARRRALFALYE
ncbi:MAG: DUF4037 domain-containing protein [bacterium]|nr:DUF4037 domain-containing protein [bacterium]